jgi:hypothetical protein
MSVYSEQEEDKSEEEQDLLEKSDLPEIFYWAGGIVMFVGFITSLGMSNAGLAAVFIGWVGTLSSGLILIGFGKIIELLVKSINKQSHIQ